MRAYLSEIVNGLVMNTEIRINDWKDYRKFLNCELFTVVSIDYKGEVLSLFVDDEGLLKPNFGRNIANYPEPLFGNIVICGGVDDEGNTLEVPETITLEEVNNIVGEIAYRTNG